MLPHPIPEDPKEYLDIIPYCIEAVGRVVAAGAVDPTRAEFFLNDIVHSAWELVEEAKKRNG